MRHLISFMKIKYLKMIMLLFKDLRKFEYLPALPLVFMLYSVINY